jgi:hypothetical protein
VACGTTAVVDGYDARTSSRAIPRPHGYRCPDVSGMIPGIGTEQGLNLRIADRCFLILSAYHGVMEPRARIALVYPDRGDSVHPRNALRDAAQYEELPP